MNFDDAIKAHSSWKMKLSRYIQNPDGSLQVAQIKPDNMCELGKWLQSSTGQYGQLEEFKELKTCHSQFHKCAADIVYRADKGEKLTDELSLGSKSEYAKLSGDIVKKIMHLKKQIQ